MRTSDLETKLVELGKENSELKHALHAASLNQVASAASLGSNSGLLGTHVKLNERIYLGIPNAMNSRSSSSHSFDSFQVSGIDKAHGPAGVDDTPVSQRLITFAHLSDVPVPYPPSYDDSVAESPICAAVPCYCSLSSLFSQQLPLASLIALTGSDAFQDSTMSRMSLCRSIHIALVELFDSLSAELEACQLSHSNESTVYLLLQFCYFP